MKQWLSILLAASLLLYPFAAFAADYGSQPSQTQQVPPVAQPLVREGDFAIKLAAELDLGNPADEAIAEDMLTKAGIVPANGWLSDYPVTPEIIGQLQSSIAKAAAEGRLPMNADEATRGLYSLTAQMNLPTPAGPSASAPEGQQPSTVQSNPTVINNYYNDQGPPIITYYPPPYYDAYLYDWVPFPVFWFGFWFSGFFICHSFTTVVVTRFGDFDDRGRRGIVTNRIIDPVTRRVAIVDPVTRTSTGVVRPVTMLRTEQGRSFRNVSEMRTVYGGASRAVMNSASRTTGFRTPEARTSAGIIYSRSLEKMRVSRGPESSMVRGNDRRFLSSDSRDRSFNVPSSHAGRPPLSPNSSNRSYNAPARASRGGEWQSSSSPGSRSSERMYNAPSWGGEGRSVMPSTPSRSFSAPPMTRGGGGLLRPSSGNGWGGLAGRAFSGGVCRGKC